MNPLFAFAASIRVDSFIGPEFHASAGAYALMDMQEGSVLLGKNAYTPRPIASLTKLMTAMVAIDQHFDFSDNTTYNGTRHYAYRNYMGFRDGDVIENRDVWASMLIGSMNVPARMIVDSLGMSDEEFVLLMNRKAEMLGLHDARFVDVHGLSDKNVASAASVAKLLRSAMDYPEIAHTLGMRSYAFNETVSVDGRYQHQFPHTNVLLRQSLHIPMIASKTGYLDESGPCLAFVTRLSGEDVIVVTLGETSWTDRHRAGYDLARWWDNLSLAQKSRSEAFVVKYPGDPRVYEVTMAGPRWIPDERTFIEKGYTWNQIMEIGMSDRVRLGELFVL